MSDLPDLVRDSKLQTKVHPKYTIHRFHELDSVNGARSVIREEYWRRHKYIGGGSYGCVWLERCVKGSRDHEVRAVKEIIKSPVARKNNFYSRELEALAKFSHDRYVRCFVKSLGWYEHDNTIYIAMEYFALGDLNDYLATSPAVLEVEAKEIVFQLLEGLSFLHENGFAHRDLKPSNVLVKAKPPEKWWVKIGDFGISKRAVVGAEASSTLKGTLGFMPPELHGFVDEADCYEEETQSGACAADMWSLGEMTFQMLTKEACFKNMGILSAYVSNDDLFPSSVLLERGISSDGIELTKSLMLPAPRRRINAEMAMTHAWIAPCKIPSPRPLSLASLEYSDSDADLFLSNDVMRAEPSGKWSTISAHPVMGYETQEESSLSTSKTTTVQVPTSDHEHSLSVVKNGELSKRADYTTLTPSASPGFATNPDPDSTPRLDQSFLNVANAQESASDAATAHLSEPGVGEAYITIKPILDDECQPGSAVPDHTLPGAAINPVKHTTSRETSKESPSLDFRTGAAQEWEEWSTARNAFDAKHDLKDSEPTTQEASPSIESEPDPERLNDFYKWLSGKRDDREVKIWDYARISSAAPVPNEDTFDLTRQISIQTLGKDFFAKDGINTQQKKSSEHGNSHSNSSGNKTAAPTVVRYRHKSASGHRTSFVVSEDGSGQVIDELGNVAGQVEDHERLLFMGQKVTPIMSKTHCVGWELSKRERENSRIRKERTVTDRNVNDQISGPNQESDQPHRQQVIHQVTLFRGNFVMDLPHDTAFLKDLPYQSSQVRDEFTHYRYTAVTCPAADFALRSYTLRPLLFAAKRQTEVLITLSFFEWPAAKEFHNFLKDVRIAFNELSRSNDTVNALKPRDVWKSVVILFVGPNHDTSTQSLFDQLGLIHDWMNSRSLPLEVMDDRGVLVKRTEGNEGPISNMQGSSVKAHVYEYTTQKRVLQIGKSFVSEASSSLPMQLILCRCNDGWSIHDWSRGFAALLGARLTITYDLYGTVPEIRRTAWTSIWKSERPLGDERKVVSGLPTAFSNPRNIVGKMADKMLLRR